MSTHQKRLLNGVRELVHLEESSLEDLHVILTDLVVFLDKKTESIAKKLKTGQEIQIYDENSKKEYGAKGSTLTCYFKDLVDVKGNKMLSVYDNKGKTWKIPLYCLLDFQEVFDPMSAEGKKIKNKDIPKKRGRKPKKLKELEEYNFSANEADYENLAEDSIEDSYDWEGGIYFEE